MPEALSKRILDLLMETLSEIQPDCSFGKKERALAVAVVAPSLFLSSREGVDRAAEALYEAAKVGQTATLEATIGVAIATMRKIILKALTDFGMTKEESQRLYKTLAKAIYLALLATEGDVVDYVGEERTSNNQASYLR